MVVPEQVEHGVDGEISDFAVEGVAVALGLLHRFLEGQDNVAQLGFSGGQVHIVNTVNAEGERQDVGLLVDVAVGLVEFTDLLVVDDLDGNFRVFLEFFHDEHCGAAAADEQTKALRDLDGFLIVGDDDFDFLCHGTFLLISCGSSSRRPFPAARHTGRMP